MGFRKDITGKRYGRLTVLRFLYTDKHGHSIWECKCDCGTIKPISKPALKNVLSCGCYHKEQTSKARSIDLVGQKFGRLTVISLHGSIDGSLHWNCRCECQSDTDDYFVANGLYLRLGDTKSCGCLNRDKIYERSTASKEAKLIYLKNTLLSLDGYLTSDYLGCNKKISYTIMGLNIKSRVTSIDSIKAFKDILISDGNILLSASSFSQKSGISFVIETPEGVILNVNKIGYHKYLEAKNDFNKFVEKKGHKLLTPYISATDKVLIDFNCSHEPQYVRAIDYKHSNRQCPLCSNTVEGGRLRFYENLERNNHNALTDYISAKDKVLVDFNCGHNPHWVTPNDYNNGCRCPRCSVSKGELIIMNYLDALCIEYSHRKWLPNRKEYDIYIPKYNLYVEVHGIQHYETVDYFSVSGEKQQDIDLAKKLYILNEINANYMEIDYREGKPELALNRFKIKFQEYLQKSP